MLLKMHFLRINVSMMYQDVMFTLVCLGLGTVTFQPVTTGRSLVQSAEAVACKKKVVIILADEEEAEIPPKFVDKGKAAEQIGELRNELQAAYLIHQFFKTPDDAAKQVLTALSKIARMKNESMGRASRSPTSELDHTSSG